MATLPFVGGNWKMNLDGASAAALAEQVVAGCGDASRAAEIVVFPPYPYLERVARVIGGSTVALGGQDLSSEANGARTGEVSAEMLLDVGASWVIVGHSERRQKLGESDAVVADKLSMALESGLKCVLCCGETLEERKARREAEVVARQVAAALGGVSASQMERIVIAYEPIWAIGTGVVATPEDAEAAHRAVRATLASRYDSRLARESRVVYGGSLAPGNAKALFARPGVDGGLVGGASLKAPDFLAICSAASNRMVAN
jgi:triosephosphate isomerase